MFEIILDAFSTIVILWIAAMGFMIVFVLPFKLLKTCINDKDKKNLEALEPNSEEYLKRYQPKN